MHALTSWFIRNPVAANLIMLLILVGGVFTMLTMRIEGFPKLPADTIQIETTFINAYTEQVDQQITQKIEKALEGLPGVKKVQSSSAEEYSVIYVQKSEGYQLQRLLDDVRTRLDSIPNLPREAERPVITRNDFDFPALIVQLYGETDTRTLQQLGRHVREELLAQPEISKLNVWGERKPEITIQIRAGSLEKYNLTISDLMTKIQQSSLIFKAGSLKTKGGRISLRADSQAYNYRDFAEIPILEKADGTPLWLSEIADIRDHYEDDDVIVRFNGQPALGMEVLIGREESLLEIAAAVQATVAKLQITMPTDIKLSIWADSSHYISERLNLLRDNAFQGLIFVFILLAIFLNVKLAFWVAMGIPISVAGAMAVIGSQWIDYSLNDITTFGFIIALGILVDDAVVVGESVFEQRKLIADPIIGTEKGVQRVATATIYGVLTTVAAFFPMLLIDNAMGKIMASFSGVVIIALLFSLFESKFILPAHLAAFSLSKSYKKSGWIASNWNRLQEISQQYLKEFVTKIYRPALEWSLKQRYAVLILFLSFAVLGLGLIGTGNVKTVFFPDIPGQVITVKMEMDARAPYRLTLKNAAAIEEMANIINLEFVASHGLSKKPIKHILVAVTNTFSVDIYAELLPAAERESLSTLDVLKEWQQRVGQLEGTTQLSFSGSEETAGGFAIQLFSKNEDDLALASQELSSYLQNINGISNIRDDLKTGKPELLLQLKPGAQRLGFTNETLAIQMGMQFGGAETQRIQRANEEIRVIVKNHDEARSSIESLMQTRLRSEYGQWFPLLAIAEIKSSYATDYISRRDGKRVNTIRAYVDKTIVAPSEIAQSMLIQFLPDLKIKYPLVEIKNAGELEEAEVLKGGLIKALLFTCVLIYALLAIPLKSYWLPFIIMSVIPFGFVGAAMGHWIMNLPLSLLSFFGMLALAGVVVNDSLVMITRYNDAKSEGLETHDALISCGIGRFQAIFLTTATTVAGLTPLLLETSEQAQYLIPAAVSLAYGEIFATAITLILVPILIAISADVKVFFTTFFSQQQKGLIHD